MMTDEAVLLLTAHHFTPDIGGAWTDTILLRASGPKHLLQIANYFQSPRSPILHRRGLRGVLVFFKSLIPFLPNEELGE